MYSLLRPLLFQLDAEKAHGLTLSLLNILPKQLFKKPQENPVQVLGMRFKHPIGLAAGLDKNGEYLDALDKLGFSYIEVGTITPRAQAGNPKPRLFRLPQEEAIINRMGFNNQGVDVLVSNLKKSHYSGILGINIGKNKDTPLDRAVEDYCYCLEKVYELASYVTINISSPNTPDLRALQQENYLDHLLAVLTKSAARLRDRFKKNTPLIVKISPDEGDEALKRMSEVILRHKISGLIATNTTSSRNLVKTIPHADEVGGLSGKPLQALSGHCLKILKEQVGDEVVLIGVGGIDSYASAQDRLNAGAQLLQVYTGLIYHGPKLVLDLNKRN